MGNCVYCSNRPQVSKQVIRKVQHMLLPDELLLLHLIFQDLSHRTVERKVNRQNFLLFFHKNGLWGEQLFRQFKSEDDEFLPEEEFVRGIACISKLTQIEKINLLFKFFSRGNINKGVAFDQFLTMLYNYPKQDLRLILNDRQFIELQLKKRMVLLDRHSKDGLEYNTYFLESSNSIQNTSNTRISDRNIRLPSMIGREVFKSVAKGKNKETVISFSDGKQVCQIRTTNIQQMVKKFAIRLFKEAGINPKDGKLTFQQFARWIQSHRALYQSYYSGFHHLVWQFDKVLRKARYLLQPSEKKSQGRLAQGEKRVPVLLYLQQFLLVVCDREQPQRPYCVLCLQGLSVQRCYSVQDGFGFQVSHRDGIYPQKHIYLRDEALLLEWMELLHFYRGQTVQQKYEIGAKIGTGKFSVVYRCRQLTDGKPYALKEIATFKLQPQAHSSIAHQSSIMQVISHPLLLQFKQCIQTRSYIYIVTQLVQGIDLFDYVHRKQFLSQYDAAKITQQIIVGLRYLHSFEIVHRDLKPQNIMVMLNEQQRVESIKIIDFGFSNYLSHVQMMTPDERLVGTPNYIAPEVLKQQEIGFQIDNFSLGVILYFMLTGSLPFNDYAITSILENTLKGDYQFPDRRALSRESIDLTSRLLNNDPKQRISLQDALKHPWFQVLKQPRKPTRVAGWKGKSKTFLD